jgi:GNAT superfamily N-acetyltransferase
MTVVTTEPIQIAGPTREWFMGVMDASRAIHAEIGQHPLSYPKLAAVIWRGLIRQGAMIGVIGQPEYVKAMIYLEVDDIYYSDDMVLTEKFNFVRPEFRKSDYAKRLIRFAKETAAQTGLDLMIGIFTDKRLEAKERLYNREFPEGRAGVWYRHKHAVASPAELDVRQ